MVFTIGCFFYLIAYTINEFNIESWGDLKSETLDTITTIMMVIGNGLIISSLLTLTWKYLP